MELYGYWRFIIHIKDEYLYKDNADDVKKRHDTLNYDGDRPLPKRISIGLMKHELRGKITTEFLALRPKTYSTEKMMLKMVKRLKE